MVLTLIVARIMFDTNPKASTRFERPQVPHPGCKRTEIGAREFAVCAIPPLLLAS
jgi:hypothetical protein